MGVRVESLESQLDTQTFFAHEWDRNSNTWEIDYNLDSLPLQDPSHVKIGNKTLILGVSVKQDGDCILWKQDIYVGDSIDNLEYLTSGPVGMKDIRLVDLGDRIGVFTRPQGIIGGKGKIAYLEVSSIDELKLLSDSDWYEGGVLIEGLFSDDTWGGVNQARKISENEIKIIGHIAYQIINNDDELEKHYLGMSFVFDRQMHLGSKFEIIARRTDFPVAPAKRTPELDNVVFSAGVDEENIFYCGLSDRYVGKKKL